VAAAMNPHCAMTQAPPPEHEHGHGHPHAHAANPPPWPIRLAGLGVAVGVLVLNATGVFTHLLGVDTALGVAVVAGAPLLLRAVRSLRSRDLNFDVTIALAAVIAVAAGQFLAAGEVTLIVLAGDALEHWAMHRADHAIAGLLSIQPARVSVLRDGREVSIAGVEVRLTDRVITRSGECIAVDGLVVGGEARVDQSLVTGESVASVKTRGARVFSGTLVEQGALDIQPEHVGEDTTVARIARLIADARRRRAPIVRAADRLARLLLPILIGSALAVYLVTGEILRGVSVLLVGCSCALVYATPAAFSAALARLSRRGVLVKGGDVIERLATVGVVAFDKTGTLTMGQPSVTTVIAADGADPNEVIRLAAAVESRSEHALGRAIVAEAARLGLEVPAVDGFTQSPGLGVTAEVGGRRIGVGNAAFTRGQAAEAAPGVDHLVSQIGASADTHVVVSIDGAAAGLVVFHDAPRSDAGDAVAALRAAGVSRIVMLTGDSQRTAAAIAAQVGIEPADVYADLLPADKLLKVRDLSGTGTHVLMVGDGINDAPALAAAHVGLAFGRGAADLSAETAQVVVLDSGLADLPDLLAFARRTVRRVQINIFAFAIGVNALAILAAALGYLTPAGSAILHQVVSLSVILSSVSLLVEGRVRAGTATTWRALVGQRVTRLRTTALPRVTALATRHRRVLWRSAAAVAVCAWLLSGLVELGPGEAGVVQRFGRMVASNLGPGLHLRAPWPIETVTRLASNRIRVIEIGFRSPSKPTAGPIDYEWNTPHDAEGLVQQVADENLVLTGDENMAELYAVVHYRIGQPSVYLFGARDPEALVRVVAESVLRTITASFSLDALLTTDRHTLETRWADGMRARLTRTDVGIDVLGIHLTDVHPPVDVVTAFRDVASAQEEELMNTLKAEAYLKEQIPLARGQAQANLAGAAAYQASRVDRSRGDAARFLAQLPGGADRLTRFRLQVETLETVLPGKRVIILDDHSGGRRSLIFLEGGSDLLKLLPGGGASDEGGGDSSNRDFFHAPNRGPRP
jgi:Cu+-exporting ATPase